MATGRARPAHKLATTITPAAEVAAPTIPLVEQQLRQDPR